MNLIFLGYAVNRNEAGHLSGTSVAGNKMALNILERLNHFQGMQLQIVTLYPIPAYPKDRTIVFRGRSISLSKDLNAFCVGFLNFPAVKQFCQIITLYRYLKRALESSPHATVLTYNLYPQIGIPLGWLKRQYPCSVATLLADPPVDVLPRSGLSRLLRRAYYREAERCLRNVDKLIVVNEHAAKLFAPDLGHIVVEGGVNPQEYPTEKTKKAEKKIIVYSGALTEYNGIRELLEAIKKVKNGDVVLHIYGSGPLENLVKQSAAAVERVVYCGNVDNWTVLKMQREAFLLISPRRVEEPVSQVTFPSKIFEYMMSETPILTTRLNGFSSDYFDKMFFAENNRSDVLAEAIDRIASMDQAALLRMAEKAKNFVLREKTWDRQVDRIYRFIRQGEKEDSALESQKQFKSDPT